MGSFDDALIAWVIQIVHEFYDACGRYPSVAEVRAHMARP